MADEGLEIRIFEQDLSEISTIEDYYERFSGLFTECDVGMVVLCAGVGWEGQLEHLSDREVNEVMAVNVLHPVYLSRVAIDFMSKREGRGCIMTVSSQMDFRPCPSFSAYSSSKAFITSFSSALAAELEHDPEIGQNIDLICYSPGMVATKLNGAAQVPFIVPSPDQVASYALHDCGLFKLTFATLTHSTLYYFMKAADNFLGPICDLIMSREGKQKLNRRREKARKVS
mmetsp:Transcript_17937/g.30513  ORF Transcript_17937/g.30513 Transcript_17937/m.30513 type:complete len:229 (-) Transcript_17937:55-741(-)